MKKLKLLLLLAFLFDVTSSSHISCGRAFIPCETENGILEGQATVTRPRVYGISSAHFTRQRVPEPLVRVTAHEAMREVRTFFETDVNQKTDIKSPLYSTIRQFANLYPLQDKAKNFSEAAYVSNIMSLRLKKLGLREADITLGLDPKVLMNTELGTVCPRAANEPCDVKQYRSITGGCNNVKKPLWGAAFEPFNRLGGSAYSDGIMGPRESKLQKELPNVRILSNELFSHPSSENKIVSELVSFWLYFIGSDIAQSVPAQVLTPDGPVLLPCCEPGFIHADCDPIYISPDDSLYSKFFVKCLPHTRSLPAPRDLCTLGPREQTNVVTSFLDGSQIYGSTLEQQKKLRAKDGKLLTSSLSGVSDLLPLDPETNNYCQSGFRRKCFLSGTSDVNILPEVSALHLLFVRQHNHVADALKVS